MQLVERHTPAVNYRQLTAPSELYNSTTGVFRNVLRHAASISQYYAQLLSLVRGPDHSQTNSPASTASHNKPRT
jgi:hypothetical protein